MAARAVPVTREMLLMWYPRPDSNRHARRRGILNPLRLPFRHLGNDSGLPRARVASKGILHPSPLPRLTPRVAHVLAGADKTENSTMLRKLYDWTLSMVDHPQALWVLAFVSFIESSVFPIPPDVLMIPMIIARPSRAWLIAGVALVASVLGGLLGYAIGAFAFDTVGRPILEMLGKADAMAAFNSRFNELGFWAVLTAGVTPFPYKVITIMSGWT